MDAIKVLTPLCFVSMFPHLYLFCMCFVSNLFDTSMDVRKKESETERAERAESDMEIETPVYSV